jgi:hypothetical protein
MPSSFCVYGRQRQLLQGNCCPNWRAQLPSEWREQVIPPRTFRVFREYEIAARRVIGYDNDQQPCYCAYDCRLVDLCSDDDEDFYTELAYRESVTAWRIQDGRWLIDRSVEALGDNGNCERCLSIETQMPR